MSCCCLFTVQRCKDGWRAPTNIVYWEAAVPHAPATVLQGPPRLILEPQVDPSTPIRRRVLLEAAAGTRRSLQDLSSGIVTPGGRGRLSITSFKKTSSNGGKGEEHRGVGP